MFFFAPFNISARLPPPPPPNWHFIQGACCNQPHRDFLKILLNRLQEKKRKANHFKYKLSWVVRKHYHGNQNRTAFQKKKMMKGNKATIPGGKAVVVICQTSISIWSKKNSIASIFSPTALCQIMHRSI